MTAPADLPLHLKNFNAKVRAMNQSNGRILTLNAEEARSLQAEIYDLMALIASLSRDRGTDTVSGVVTMDGGGFK